MKLSSKTRSQSISLLFAIAAVIVGSAFATVWTQQQITRTAEETKRIEANLAELVRRIGFVDERIAALHQPVVLQGKVSGVLRPSVENQVVWVRESDSPAGRAYAVVSPYRTSTDLAMIEAANSQR